MEANVTETATRTEILAKLKELVVEVTQLKVAPETISDTANLFNDCGLDSTSVVDLVVGLEQHFDVTVEDDELDVKLFQDLSKLAEFVEAKQELAAA
ncbi:MAG TPA: phosphopantetheine-binding protein [Pyrinomonadaceae bacterium]|jgi:acyl carrier protein|nr:phosphopantetheine-binding protein [Pyrinomonadaceae bacterium]